MKNIVYTLAALSLITMGSLTGCTTVVHEKPTTTTTTQTTEESVPVVGPAHTTETRTVRTY